MSALGVGVIGAGTMGQRHADVFRQLPGVELVAVADVRPEAAQRVAEPSGARVYSDWRNLIADRDVAAVSVCTPDWLHRAPVVAAAEAGKHILLEKPLATTLADSKAMLAAVQRTEVTLLVGHILHFDPRYAMPLAAVRRGELGQLIHVYARRNNPFTSAHKYGGKTTVLQFLGIHDIEFVLALVGERPLRVYAETHRARLKDLGVDDVAFTLVTFPSGIVASFEHSWALPEQPYRALDARLDAVGTEGMIRVDCAYPASLIIAPSGPQAPDVAYGPLLHEHYAGAVYHEVRHFVECIQKQCAPLVSLETAYQAVRVVVAAQEAAGTGAAVSLEP